MLWSAIFRAIGVANCGGRDAIVTDDVAVTYAELTARVEALAARLGAAGVAPGQVVLVFLENVPSFLVTLLAISKLGAAYAPLEVGLTDPEAAGILALVRSDLVVCDESSAARCARLSQNLVIVDDAGEVVEVRITALGAPSLDPNIACVQFSSGTTGAAKGILLSREAFFHRTHDVMRALGLGPADRTLCALPLSHTHGAECLALPTLMATGTLFLMSPKYAFPLYVLEELARRSITFYSSIPQFYDFAVKLESATLPNLHALRLPFCGSAALARTTAESFHSKYGVHIRQGYGLAELSVICMNDHAGAEVAYDSIGRPIEGIEWRLAPEGEREREREGELVVRSKAMFSGYLDDEASTRAKLRDGWLHTGDLVSVDERGLFRVVGRKDDFVKVNGFKVYAAEVEKAIASLAWIAECAVLGDRDELGTERIVAHIVPTPSHASRAPQELEAALLRELRGALSEYKLPRRTVVWPSLPKSPLGKILKARLASSSPSEASDRQMEIDSP